MLLLLLLIQCKISLYLGPVRTVRPVRCFVTTSAFYSRQLFLCPFPAYSIFRPSTQSTTVSHQQNGLKHAHCTTTLILLTVSFGTIWGGGCNMHFYQHKYRWKNASMENASTEMHVWNVRKTQVLMCRGGNHKYGNWKSDLDGEFSQIFSTTG